MSPFKAGLNLLLLCCLLLPLHAELGFTPEQSEARFGAPSEEFLQNDRIFRTYVFDNYRIQENYDSGRCNETLYFSMSDTPLSAEQSERLLQGNTARFHWIGHDQDNPTRKTWIREDRKAVARWDGKVLAVMSLDRFNTLYPEKNPPKATTPEPKQPVAETPPAPPTGAPKPFFQIVEETSQSPLLLATLGLGGLLFLIGHIGLFLKSFQESTFWFVVMFFLLIVVTALTIVNQNMIYLIFIPLSSLPFMLLHWHVTVGSRWFYILGLMIFGAGAYFQFSSIPLPEIRMPKQIPLADQLNLSKALSKEDTGVVAVVKKKLPIKDSLVTRVEESFDQKPTAPSQPE